jgi:hypothetical protein
MTTSPMVIKGVCEVLQSVRSFYPDLVAASTRQEVWSMLAADECGNDDGGTEDKCSPSGMNCPHPDRESETLPTDQLTIDY